MHKLLATLPIIIAIGCAAEPGTGSGEATTFDDSDAVVLGIRHADISITVYKHSAWVAIHSSDCKGLRGEITDNEMSELEEYLADEALETLGTECSGDAYRLMIGSRPAVCWTPDFESPGVAGLKTFYAEIAEQLAAIPAGKCGAPQNI